MSPKRDERPAYVIDTEAYRRFDQRRTVFGRIVHDEGAPYYGKSMYENVPKIISEGREGCTREEFAKALGAWTVYNYFSGAFSRVKLTGPNSVMAEPAIAKKPEVEPSEMSRVIKEAAKRYGASLVGICPLDRRWVYSRDLDGEPVEIPERMTRAIVMAIGMDPGTIRTSPKWAACAESALGYSRMAFVIACLAEFIRNMGYNAVPAGNDTALSIPLAIDAGLGELGRNGLLITPELGPCVRLCKVITDLPLETDKPVEFGVREFCRKCRKCVEVCEVDAISAQTEPSFNVACPSNNTGIERWAVNVDRCYSFWIENGGDCSSCIAVCPFVSNG